MDAKAKANFINSVAGKQKIPCPNCNSLNDEDAIFCNICGTKIGNEQDEAVAPAFAPARTREMHFTTETQGGEQKFQTDVAKPAFQMVMPEQEEVTERISVFAEGLPNWDVLPPQVAVRRKSK